MNFLKLSFLFAIVLFLSGCGDDDDAVSCMQSDWVGTYNGLAVGDCLLSTGQEDAVITLTASGATDVIIGVETDSGDIEFDPLTPNGCQILDSETDGGLTLVLEATLDGDNIRIEFGDDDDTTEDCVWTGTRG